MPRRSQKDIYREKYNLVQKINKRIRDTVNRIGVMNETVQIFETALEIPGRKGIQAWDTEGNLYHLLSRSKEDIESYTLADLKLLEKQTPQWKTTKSQIIREMNRDRESGEEFTLANPPTMEELKQGASITHQLHAMFEDNADLFYMLLDTTGWDDIKEHSTLEIYQETVKIRNFLDKGGVFDWSAPPEDVGESYIARREASRDLRNAALQKSYFEE